MNSEKSESGWRESVATVPPSRWGTQDANSALRDPARQTTALKKKPGRTDRDDGEQLDKNGPPRKAGPTRTGHRLKPVLLVATSGYVEAPDYQEGEE